MYYTVVYCTAFTLFHHVRLHGKALLVSFDSDDTSAEAEVLSTDIKHRLRNLDREVKALSGMAYGDNQDVVKGV